jgi:DNA-binding transcriptional MerR regulator
MKQQTDSLWTLVELGQQVQEALAADPLAPRNGRIRAVPDSRTIRYYTTIGLIERPAAMRGRTALYSERHLQQLMAIKRLQARGLSLAEVQQALAGLPDTELATLAELPLASPPSPTAIREGVWRDALPEHTPDTVASPNPERSAKSAGAKAVPEPSAVTGADLYHGLALAPGVTLLLHGQVALSADDVRALRHAAAPLLEALRQRG